VGGGQSERSDRPRGLGEVRSPDPRAPIRPPLLIEADSDVESDETAQEQPGRASSGAGPNPSELPGERAAGTCPISEARADVEVGQGATTPTAVHTNTITHNPHQTLATSPRKTLATSHYVCNLYACLYFVYDSIINIIYIKHCPQ